MNDYNKRCESVEDLLKNLKRPATSYELIVCLSDFKNGRSVRSELKTLLSNGSVRKMEVKLDVGRKLTVYIRVPDRKKQNKKG